VAQARGERCDVVVALGGGSVIDAGKAVAAMLTNPGELRDHLEVVGRGRPLTDARAPLVAIPTTAGTGAEVTRNAVLMVEEERVKVSLRSALMLPTVALIDPELTYSLPPAVTASTGLDALAQCLEPFVTPPRARSPTPSRARGCGAPGAAAARSGARSATAATARRGTTWRWRASAAGWRCQREARRGPRVRRAARRHVPRPARRRVRAPPPAGRRRQRARAPARAPDSAALARYDEAARILTGRARARAEDAAAWLRELVDDLAVPALSTYGVAQGRRPRAWPSRRAARAACRATRSRSPTGELAEVLRGAL
jgi:alcohol dehydrogenase class IV